MGIFRTRLVCMPLNTAFARLTFTVRADTFGHDVSRYRLKRDVVVQKASRSRVADFPRPNARDPPRHDLR